MSANLNQLTYIATTGAGVTIGGTNGILLGGMYRSSDLAGTLILKSGTTTLFTMSADRSINFATPVVITGPVTMTSSAGGSFLVAFKSL